MLEGHVCVCVCSMSVMLLEMYVMCVIAEFFRTGKNIT